MRRLMDALLWAYVIGIFAVMLAVWLDDLASLFLPTAASDRRLIHRSIAGSYPRASSNIRDLPRSQFACTPLLKSVVSPFNFRNLPSDSIVF
jgi:hypothetical protein